MHKSKQQEMFKAQIMSSLDEQTVSKKQQDIQHMKDMADLDRKQMEYTIAKDEGWKKREEKKNVERRQHAHQLMHETSEKHRIIQEQCANGGARGEKMTREELRLNKELLKEVSKIKKQGNINDLLEEVGNERVRIWNHD